ncbi:uncharacterized protein LOC108679263 [Hyalella azteca]|uniref:Uncharacterized protein LOC108679263 n=1 Tax=Hyalella azteca TaxID=294128 RepID=A0A8B7PDJ5_HYAAZ|nr:uncharacterized protein LOC108679263 [Hyalella azteca]XP_047736602.1 uncharacterized protein LOC108679263 [Hyalella azteca]
MSAFHKSAPNCELLEIEIDTKLRNPDCPLDRVRLCLDNCRIMQSKQVVLDFDDIDKFIVEQKPLLRRLVHTQGDDFESDATCGIIEGGERILDKVRRYLQKHRDDCSNIDFEALDKMIIEQKYALMLLNGDPIARMVIKSKSVDDEIGGTAYQGTKTSECDVHWSSRYGGTPTHNETAALAHHPERALLKSENRPRGTNISPSAMEKDSNEENGRVSGNVELQNLTKLDRQGSVTTKRQGPAGESRPAAVRRCIRVRPYGGDTGSYSRHLYHYWATEVISTLGLDLPRFMLNLLLLPMWVVLVSMAEVYCVCLRIMGYFLVVLTRDFCNIASALMRVVEYVFAKSNIEETTSRIKDTIYDTFCGQCGRETVRNLKQRQRGEEGNYTK